MRGALGAAVLLAVAAALSAADAPPPPAKEGTPEKTRLGGGFKGRPVSPGAKTPAVEKSAPLPPGSRKPPARVTIDNSMVKKNAPPGDARSPAAPSAAPAPAPAVSMPKAVDLNGHDEAFWRARAAEVRGAAQKAASDVAAAEAEEKREENDFYAWDDGQYRDNVIKPAWDKAREEAVKARASLEAARKQLDALEDDARRAGAYPGWIRE